MNEAATFSAFACGLALATIVAALVGAQDLLTIIQTVSSVAILISAFVATRIYAFNRESSVTLAKKERSKLFLGEARQSVRRAFETFSNASPEGEAPPADRLLWLSVSRMILRFYRLRGHITEPEHLLIIDEQEEFYRYQFYSLLNRYSDQMGSGYFNSAPHPWDGHQVARNSIAVILEFVEWPDGREDPLDDFDDASVFARGVGRGLMRGAYEHVLSREPYAERVRQHPASSSGDQAAG